MTNPWEKIGLDDYESHMSLDSVYQSQTVNKMMKGQLASHKVESVMVLGVTAGNGLEYAGDVEKIIGVDVNPKYLDTCRMRCGFLGDRLELLCLNLPEDVSMLPRAELVIANLFVEYVGYEAFALILDKISPKYVSVIIQINQGETYVSDSPYMKVFYALDDIHHQMSQEGLTSAMANAGFELNASYSQPLPNGKKLVQLDFISR